MLTLQATLTPSQKVNWKIHRNSSLKIFEHENIVLCIYHINFLFNFKQFHHHWKLLKTLDFNIYQGFLFFVLYTVIPGYFNEFIYEIMKWNISKIKHHSYEVLNLQVYLIVLVLTHAILWDFLQRKGDFYYRNAIFSTFTPWKWIFSNALNHKCSLQWRIHN